MLLAAKKAKAPLGSEGWSAASRISPKRLQNDINQLHRLPPFFKQVHIFELAEGVLTCRAEVQQLHGMA